MNEDGRLLHLARRALLGGAIGLPFVAGPRDAAAQDGAAEFPARPVRLIVPFAPGGATDVATRLVAQRFATLTSQQMVVDNRGGAGGDIAMIAATGAAPDGYALVLGNDASQVRGPVLRTSSELPYDPAALAPVARVVQTWQILAVPSTLPVRNMAELVAHCRASREPVAYGSAGPGTLSHAFGELLARRENLDLVHVPYRGASPAMQDLAAGRVQFLFTAAGGLLSAVSSGPVRVIAISGDNRQPALRDVPTLAEAGFADLNLSTWYGVMTPARTPAAVVDRLGALFGTVLTDQSVAGRLEEQGLIPAYLGPAPFRAFIAEQTAVWRDIAARTGLRL